MLSELGPCTLPLPKSRILKRGLWHYRLFPTACHASVQGSTMVSRYQRSSLCHPYPATKLLPGWWSGWNRSEHLHFLLTHTKGLSFDFSVRAYSLTHCGIVHSSHRTRGMEVGKWGQSQQAQGCQNSGLAMTSLLPRGLKLSRAALVTTQSHSKLSSRAQYKAVSSSEKFLLWNPLPLQSLHLNGQLLVYPYTQK